MTDTNKRFAIVTDAREIGVLPATEQPVTLEMAGRADPQRTTDFQAVLLAMAGHDLRGPLQIIQGSHDLLGIGVRTKSEQRLLQRGQHAINHLNGLLDQLLGAVRLYEHSKEAKLSPVALEPLLRQACHENAEGALQKGIDVRVCPTGASVISNAVLLNGILRNLVSNAIKYTEPNGRVLIGCRRSGQNVRIDVCDTGIGIAGEQLSLDLIPHGVTGLASGYSSCAGPSKCSGIASMSAPSPPEDHASPYSQRERTRRATASRRAEARSIGKMMI
jgi:two-component system, OmpR family, phosphate regulon sensor histidine kinase PhoR